MQATIVFKAIWDAINERTEDGDRKYRYFVLEGSSRSSKTRSLLQAYYLYANQNENKRMSVWRDTAKDCKDTVGHDMSKVYPAMEHWDSMTFHKVESIYTTATKSTIEIRGTDEEVKVHGFQGDVIWMNEPYKISKDTFDQLDMRTSDIVFIDWNPKQAHWVDDIKKDPRCKILYSTFRDNPFCPPEQRKKILSYQSVKMSDVVISGFMKEQAAKTYNVETNTLLLAPRQLTELIRCKENEAKSSSSDYKWSVYGLGLKAEKPNRIFKWIKIPDAQYNSLVMPTYYGVDWGKSDPWGIVEAKYKDRCLYLHEINYTSENILRERLTPTELLQIDEKDEGFVSWYFSRFNIPKAADIICDTNRPNKTGALRRLGYTRAQPAGNKSILDGIDVLSDITVYYTESSKNIEYEQENYSRKTDRYGIVLDEAEDMDNHLIDPARYIALHLQRLGIIRTA